MAQFEYSDNFLWHLENTLNIGSIDNADGFGEARSETAWCGDVVRIWISIEGAIINDIKFRVYGCAAVIAAGSFVTEWVKGKSVDEVAGINLDILIAELGEIPSHKKKCFGTVLRALKSALEDC